MDEAPKSFGELFRARMGRLDYCPVCSMIIGVTTSPTAEKDFKEAWEAHAATHNKKEN